MLTELFASRIEDELSRASQAKLQELQTKLEELEAKLRQIEDSYNKELAPSVLETRVVEWWNRSEKQIIAKGSTEKTSVQLLTDGNLRTICDYCKYIGIAEPEDIRLGVQAVWVQLEQHPEYLAIICVWEELQSLLEFFCLPNGVCSKKPDDHAIAIALSLGFVDMREERVDRRNYLMLCPTKEAQKLLSCHTDAEWKRACESTQRTKMAVADLLHLYSLIEIPAFCDLYRRYYDVSTKDEDIQRIIYLGGTFRKEITTGVMKTNAVPFIAENYLDSEQILQLLEKADAGEMNYRIFSKEERKKAKNGFCSLYPAWQEYYQFIDAQYELDEEELEEWLLIDYYDVINGCSTQRLWENLLGDEGLDNLHDYTVFWKIFLRVYLSTGLPQYKGYSRREYAKKKGIPLLQICNDIGEETGNNISEETENGINEESGDNIGKGTENDIALEEKNSTRKKHLYQLPAELQLRLYQVLENESNAYQEKELGQILRNLQDGNCEIEFFYAITLFDDGKLQEAKALFSRIRKDYPEDSKIKQFLRLIYERSCRNSRICSSWKWKLRPGKTQIWPCRMYRQSPACGQIPPPTAGNNQRSDGTIPVRAAVGKSIRNAAESNY